MRYTIYVVLSLLLFTYCKPEVVDEPPLVHSLVSPAGANSSLPFLYSHGRTTLLSWVEKVNDSVSVLKYAGMANGEWQRPKQILQGTDWFVNWADFPAIAEHNGHLISHVLKKSSADTYSYDIKLNLLPKGDTIWNTDRPLHTDGTATEHGFVTILPYKEGFFITWLDGRNTLEDANGNRGAMTLRAAEVSAAGTILNETELDSRICDCCQTTAAITQNGPVVMYRDRSENEVRDMSIVRWNAGGWTEPKTVFADNWEIAGCPVNGPKASSFGNTLAMAWFTAAQKSPRVQLVFSSDGGTGFDDPIVISEAKPLGRVDVLLLNEREAIVSWMDQDTKAQLKAVKVNRDGSLGQQHVVADMNNSRQSGFPQMELIDDKVYFAWTEVVSKTTQVKTAYILRQNF